MASGLPPKVEPWLPGLNTPFARPPHDAGAHRHARSEALGERHHVGQEAGVLVDEPLAGAPEAALHLVGHEEPWLRSQISCRPRRYSRRDTLMPPSPWIGSTNTATTFLLWSATWRTASRSFSGTRTKPDTRGSNPACTLRLPVAERVASERPWNAFSITMIAGSAMPRSWPYLRATLIAASFASRPELQKNTSSRPVISRDAVGRGFLRPGCATGWRYGELRSRACPKEPLSISDARTPAYLPRCRRGRRGTSCRLRPRATRLRRGRRPPAGGRRCSSRGTSVVPPECKTAARAAVS